MLRNIPAHVLQESQLGQIVEPMVWVYVEDVDRFVDSLTWANYGEVFPHIWAASAFKGAFGERLFGVNVQRHVGNNLAWLEVMRRETLSSGKLSFRGLVLTGWSRYDHFAVLCELLPVAMPSLILNLVIITQGTYIVGKIARVEFLPSFLFGYCLSELSPFAASKNIQKLNLRSMSMKI